jgi:DNA-binding NarL/FixJ family response regulator
VNQTEPRLEDRLMLTKREGEIVSLVVQGLANKNVAAQLGLCEGTVKLHLHSIYRKLGVPNRATLILSTLTDRGK